MTDKTYTSINRAFFRAMALLSAAFITMLFITSSVIFYGRIFRIEQESAIRQLSYISDQLSYYLRSVDNYSKTIMIDASIQSYMKTYNEASYKLNALDDMAIKRKINQIIQSTRFIHSVSLYGPDKKRIATTAISPYPQDLTQVESIPEAIWLPSKKYSNTNSKKVLYCHSLVRPFYDYSTGTLLGYVEFAVPESTISDIFLDKASAASRLFIINAQGTIESSYVADEVGGMYPLTGQVISPGEDHWVFAGRSIIFTRYFPVLNWYLVNEVDLFHLLQPSIAAFGFSLAIAVFSLLVSLYVSHRLARTITSPIASLIAHTQKIKRGNWQILEESSRYSDINLLFSEFNTMLLAQEQLKNELVDSERAKNNLSLELLQQQINPHFLYNTLDNICSIAEMDEKQTLIDLVMNLSTFYRQGLSNGSNRVTIQRELEITRAYLQIMKVRYYNRFDYTIDCPEDLLRFECIKFLLQPIVENSIYHGIKEMKGFGWIQITVRAEPGQIVFTIRDNGIGLDPGAGTIDQASSAGHFGIRNINQRIQLYYGKSYGLQLANHPDGGCLATVTIGRKEVV